MLRLERVVGAIPNHPSPISFVKVQRLRTLSQSRGVEFSRSNIINSLYRKLNPSISVNVLAFEESSRGFTVEYRSPEREREHLEDADNPSKQHYVWIKICLHSFVTEPIRIIAHSSAILVCIPLCLSECSTITCRTVFNTSLNRSSIQIPKTKRTAYESFDRSTNNTPPFLSGVRF